MGQKEFHLFRIVAIYAIFGSLWILLSDNALAFFVRDHETFVRFSEYKGMAFIVVTTGLLAGLCAQYLAHYRKAEETLRLSEERFRRVFENAPIGMFQSTPEGRLLRVNRATVQLFGYRSPEDMIQRVANISRQLFVNEGQRTIILRDASATTGFVCHETLFRRVDGTTFVGNQYTRIVRDGAEATFVEGFVEDISERKAAADALRLAKDAAEGASRAKDQFIAVLSHELRTPLTPVLAQVELLRRKAGLDGEVRTGLDLIHRNVELEAQLIADLLDVNKIIRGDMRLDLKATDAYECLRGAVEICQPQLVLHGHGLKVELGAARHYVWADPIRLRQIFWNLLGNAIKYTPEGGEIVIRSSDVGEGALRVDFVDNGVGIEPELMARIFQPFVQGEQTVVRRFGGLGLGLSISKALAEAVHGTLVASSGGKDRGTTFRVELPVIAPPVGEAASVAGAGRGGNGGNGSRRILLVEDNADTLRVMAQLLRLGGHVVTTAGTVQEALGASAEGFDLLISDIGLPDGTGWELLGQLKARGPVKALAFSGFASAEDIEKSRAAGFLEHIIKPIDPVRLEEIIAKSTV